MFASHKLAMAVEDTTTSLPPLHPQTHTHNGGFSETKLINRFVSFSSLGAAIVLSSCLTFALFSNSREDKANLATCTG